MSGGVESGVSAIALAEAGYHVVGLTMKNYCYGDAGAPERSCCRHRSELPVISFKTISGCCRFSSVRRGGNT